MEEQEQLQYANPSRTEIGSMGKFPLIERLTADFAPHCATTTRAVGDDCAVIGTGDELQLVSTGMMVEGVDFDMTYTPLKHLGYKAVSRVLSNIAAMNGTPDQVLFSIAVSNRFSVEALDELYAGIAHCCERYDVDLVGGDTTSSRIGLVLSATAVGRVERSRITYRSGARPNDLIVVSGDFGSAYSGLLVLEREKVTFQADPNFQPDLASYDYVLDRFLKPEPRMDIVRMLRELDVVPTAMIDVADGLASELLHLCKQGNCGCQVYEERLPIDYQTTRVCSEMSQNMLPISCALNGGEDYELLFTIRQDDYAKLKDRDGLHVIGYMTEAGAPAVMVTPQNTAIGLRAQGWQGNQADA